MAAVNESSTAPTPRRRRRLLWPRFESQHDVDLYLRTTRKVAFAYVVFVVAGSGLPLWLAAERFPDGPAVGFLGLLITAGLLALAGGLLPARRSRVLAVTIAAVGGFVIVEVFTLTGVELGSKMVAAAIWSLPVVIGAGAIRGSWRWHVDRGSRVHWGNTAIAVAVPTLAATTITLMLLIVILVLEAMSLIPVDAEGDTAAVALATAWLLTWTALAVALTWHLPTVYPGRGASG